MSILLKFILILLISGIISVFILGFCNKFFTAFILLYIVYKIWSLVLDYYVSNNNFNEEEINLNER